jgi:hypothetical protein
MTETATINANDILMGGGGAPSAKFDEPGVTYEGRITHPPQAYQEREYNQVTGRSDGEPRRFPSGDPIMAISIDIQTSLRDPSVEDDDGTRRIYVQGKRLKEAVRNAVRDAGASGLEVGGRLSVTFTHRDDPTDKRSAKYYTAKYTPAGSAALMDEPTKPATAAPAQAIPVAPAPAPTTAGQPTPEQVAAIKAANIDVKLVYPNYVDNQPPF